MLSAALPLAIQIAVLTMTPGSDLFARFGHTAVRVDDGARVRVYNYGTFNGADPKLVDKFLHNRVDYWLSVGSWEPFLARYADRDMTVQQIALGADEAARLVAYLDWNAQPEHRAYRYDWFRNNCSTKVRDLLDYATGGLLRRQLGARAGELTIRGVLEHVLAPLPSVFFAMDIGLNRRVDEPVSRFDELAMPGDLMRALAEVKRADGAPLVSNTSLIVGPEPRPRPEPLPIVRVFLAVVLVLLALGIRFPRIGGLGFLLWAGFSGLIGVWCLIWSLFLPYPDTHFSASMWSWSPLAWAMLPTAFARLRGGVRSAGWVRWLILVIIATSVFEQVLHVAFGGLQPHFGYTAYALVAYALVLWALPSSSTIRP